MSRAGLKQRLQAKETVIGTFARIPNAELIEIEAHAGFDFVVVDTEHTPFGMETVIDLVRAADAAGVSPLVRVSENSPNLIAKALDIGSQGVVIPRIETREEAERAVQAARFHPLGQRGACPRVRAGNYSAIDSVEYFGRANERTLLVLLVETARGAANLKEIVATPGVDAILLGATDLAQSLGVPGQNDHPAVVVRLAEMADTIRRAGLLLARVASTLDEARLHRQQGVQLLIYSGDETIYYGACREAAAALRVGT